MLNSFHSFSSIECHWPPGASSNQSTLVLTADLPDVRNPAAASATLTIPALPASTLFDWLGIATQHPPTAFAGTGTLAGTLAWNAPGNPAGPASPSPRTHPNRPQPPATPAAPHASTLSGSLLSGSLQFTGESLQLSALGRRPIPLADIVLRSTPLPPPSRFHATPAPPAGPVSFDLLPIALPLGGKQPAILEGHFDASGYTLHLTGSVVPARLLALAHAAPQFGDGLEDLLATVPDAASGANAIPGAKPTPAESTAPGPSADATTSIHLDLTASRPWGAPRPGAKPPPRHPATTPATSPPKSRP